MRTRGRGGFTLVELLVVVLLIGILSYFAVPQYLKSVENSKADDAVAIVKMVGTANRMYYLDNSSADYAVGDLTTSCNTDASCPGTPTTNACPLLACRYLAAQDWDRKGYTIRACNGESTTTSCGGVTGLTSSNWVASVKRKSGASPGTNIGNYNTWGYAVDVNGIIAKVGTGTPDPTGY